MSKEDARSVPIATYFLVGELVTKTDMKPVKNYDQGAPVDPLPAPLPTRLEAKKKAPDVQLGYGLG